MRLLDIKRAVCLLPALFFASLTQAAPEVPADTYFSVAVTENSHNHYGDNLMFLDFQQDAGKKSTSPRIVVSPLVPVGSITLDGKVGDWNADLMTTIQGRVMNNYPLSKAFDAVPGEIIIGSAYDGKNLFFVVRWKDSNLDASNNKGRWVRKNGKWVAMRHTPASPSTRAIKAVNAKDNLFGIEDEDRLFFMFPIIDQQKNFQDGSLGCAGYCHPNLNLSGDPKEAAIGEGASSMHTSVPDDLADIWHWTSTRSRPMNTLKDGHLVYGDQSYNGRKADNGDAADKDNAASKPYRPIFLNGDDYKAGRLEQSGFASADLSPDTLLELGKNMKFAEGVTLPRYIGIQPNGSRSDVSTAASFDEKTGEWTVELRRALTTNDDKDHQFMQSNNATVPVRPVIIPGDPTTGKQLFKDKACASCHGENGEGKFENGEWIVPRNQRTSGPAIQKTASVKRPRRLMAVSYHAKVNEEDRPKRMMPFVHLSAQEAEDIGAWLQTRFISRGK